MPPTASTAPRPSPGWRSYATMSSCPTAERPPLFAVWSLRHPGHATPTRVERTLTLRDESGERTEHAKDLRAFSGFPEKPRR